MTCRMMRHDRHQQVSFVQYEWKLEKIIVLGKYMTENHKTTQYIYIPYVYYL